MKTCIAYVMFTGQRWENDRPMPMRVATIWQDGSHLYLYRSFKWELTYFRKFDALAMQRCVVMRVMQQYPQLREVRYDDQKGRVWITDIRNFTAHGLIDNQSAGTQLFLPLEFWHCSKQESV